MKTECVLRVCEYLQEGSCQVEGNEDGCQTSVPPSQGVDGVEEDEVSWCNQEEKHAG